MLTFVAGLLGRSALESARFDPGYDRSRGTMASLNLGLHRYGEDEGRRLQARLIEAAGRIPGVDRAMLTSGLPPFSQLQQVRFTLAGRSDQPAVWSRQTVVSPGLLPVLGFRALAGRDFQNADQEGAPLVAVVNEAFAVSPSAGPIGIQTEAAGLMLRRYELLPLED